MKIFQGAFADITSGDEEITEEIHRGHLKLNAERILVNSEIILYGFLG